MWQLFDFTRRRKGSRSLRNWDAIRQLAILSAQMYIYPPFCWVDDDDGRASQDDEAEFTSLFGFERKERLRV
jgi:hypothetical protein